MGIKITNITKYKKLKIDNQMRRDIDNQFNMCIFCKDLNQDGHQIEIGRYFYPIEDIPKELEERISTYGRLGDFGSDGIVIVYTICKDCGKPTDEQVRVFLFKKRIKG